MVEGDAEALPFGGRGVRRRDLGVRRRCSLPTRSGRRPSSSGSAAGRHDRPRELDARTGSSASCSGRSRSTSRRPPESLADALGRRGHLRRLLGPASSRSARASGRSPSGSCSAEHLVGFFRVWYGPTLKAFAALNDVAADALEADLIELVRRYDRLGGGAIAVPAAYMEAVATRR